MIFFFSPDKVLQFLSGFHLGSPQKIVQIVDVAIFSAQFYPDHWQMCADLPKKVCSNRV